MRSFGPLLRTPAPPVFLVDAVCLVNHSLLYWLFFTSFCYALSVMRLALTFILFLLFCPLLTGAAYAQEVEDGSEVSIRSKKTAIEEVEERRKSVLEQIDKLEQEPQRSAAAEEILSLLRRAAFSLGQHANALKKREVIQQELDEAKRYVEAPNWAESLSSIKTYLDLEKLHEELAAVEAQKDTVKLALQARKTALADADDEYEKRETERRKAADNVKANPANQSYLELHDKARLQSEVAKEHQEHQAAEKGNEELRLETLELKARLLRRKIARIEPRVRFTKKDLRTQLLEYEDNKNYVAKEAAKARKELDYLEKQWLASRKRLDNAEPTAEVRAERDARKNMVDFKQMEASFWEKIPELIDLLGNVWKKRYQLDSNPPGSDELADWYKQSQETVERLDIERKLTLAQLESLEKQIRVLNIQREEAADAPTVRKWVDKQVAAAESARNAIRLHAEAFDRALRTSKRFLEEVKELRKSAPLLDHLKDFGRFFSDIWSYEILAVEDSSVSIGDIIYAIIVLIIGVKISRAVSQQVAGKIMRHFGVEEGNAAAVQSLIFYFLFLIFALLALKLINVPLTVFTLFGGAIAIGVGFGSQNIMNNFISGLILLMEQPIRVGDLVEVDNQLTGTVKSIGLRSALIRTGQNIDIIVPNNKLLEQNVVNWTLTNPKVRLFVSVGVAYGSDVRKVESLLIEATQENSRVIKYPKPFVWFTDFGDNALIFELHFWARVKTVSDRRAAESSLRFKIDELFSENGIVIAFPQRDIHLDTLRPLEVKMLGGA
ncbi:MAG: mechanosensitive ion channel [Bdellovibrionales bacterium]|nr:mechanosensitive ion channel [Bdellovibrionales bacterium]